MTNWNFIVKELLNKYDCEEYIDIDNVHLHKKSLLNKMQNNIFEQYVCNWIESLHCLHTSNVSNSGNNKLRTYINFKFSFETEEYVKILMPYKHRSAMAMWGCTN